MNSDFNINLGKRIRDRRKELKLTQASVCGEYITRNMLSRVETGDVCPSIDTLMYLADKLNMPVEYFLCRDDKSAALYKKIESITEIRSLFENGLYKRCVDLCDKSQTEDSEIYLIKAESQLKLAFESMINCRLSLAEKQLEDCETTAKKCLYNADRISATVRFYKRLIQCVRENRIPDFSIFSEKNIILAEGEFIVFVYIYVTMQYTNTIHETSVESVTSTVYKNFLKANFYIFNKDYEQAKSLLVDVLNRNPGFFTLYFTTKSLEYCFKMTDDFKNAYEYAKMRLDLLDKFNN